MNTNTCSKWREERRGLYKQREWKGHSRKEGREVIIQGKGDRERRREGREEGRSGEISEEEGMGERERERSETQGKNGR